MSLENLNYKRIFHKPYAPQSYFLFLSGDGICPKVEGMLLFGIPSDRHSSDCGAQHCWLHNLDAMWSSADLCASGFLCWPEFPLEIFCQYGYSFAPWYSIINKRVLCKYPVSYWWKSHMDNICAFHQGYITDMTKKFCSKNFCQYASRDTICVFHGYINNFFCQNASRYPLAGIHLRLDKGIARALGIGRPSPREG